MRLQTSHRNCVNFHEWMEPRRMNDIHLCLSCLPLGWAGWSVTANPGGYQLTPSAKTLAEERLKIGAMLKRRHTGPRVEHACFLPRVPCHRYSHPARIVFSSTYSCSSSLCHSFLSHLPLSLSLSLSLSGCLLSCVMSSPPPSPLSATLLPLCRGPGAPSRRTG